MKIVVTGAAGFLGNNLIRKLILSKNEIIATDLQAMSAKSLQDLAIKKIDADILDFQKMEEILEGCDIVFHIAGKISLFPDRDKSMYAINVEGAGIVGRAALKAGVKKFIHVSSIHALSHFPDDEPITESRAYVADDHDLDYDVTKAKGDQLLENMAKNEGLPLITVFPTGMFGPYDFQPSFCGLSYKGYFYKKTIFTLTGGHCYVDVRDVVDALMACIDYGKIGERYILAGERWVTTKELGVLFQEVSGINGKVKVLPLWVAHLVWPLQVAMMKLLKKPFPFSKSYLRTLHTHKKINIGKATRELYYQPRPLRETAVSMKAWFDSLIADKAAN